jgi:hypothetical protein
MTVIFYSILFYLILSYFKASAAGSSTPPARGVDSNALAAARVTSS